MTTPVVLSLAFAEHRTVGAGHCLEFLGTVAVPRRRVWRHFLSCEGLLADIHELTDTQRKTTSTTPSSPGGVPAVRALRSRSSSALIDHDGSRPVEIPDVLLDALAQRLAERLAGRLADHLVGPVLPGGSPWMTFEEAVEYTRVPAGTFRKLSADGTFPAHGGKRKIYHRQELDTALLGLSG